MKVKSIPKKAVFYKTDEKGRDWYTTPRTLYMVENGVIESIHINH